MESKAKNHSTIIILRILSGLLLFNFILHGVIKASVLTDTRPGKSPVQKYRGVEIKTDLVDGKVQYRLVEGNSVEFVLNEKCQVEGLKLRIDGKDFGYRQSERVVEDGRIEKNDLFAYILYGAEAGKDNQIDLQELEFKFYRGKISPLVDDDYPLYPTLKLTADRLGLKLPHRTFVVLSGFGGASYEFFCYLEDMGPAPEAGGPDPCLLSFDQVLEIHHKNQNVSALMDLGGKYARRLDYEKAEQAYLKALSLPEARDYEPLISLYVTTRQTAKAKKFLLAALDRSPMNYDLYLALAGVYFFDGDYEKALTAARTGQKLNPERGLYKSYALVGQAYLKQQNFVEAIKAFSRAAVLVEKDCQDNKLFSRQFFNQPEDEVNKYDCRISRIPYEQSIIYALIALKEYERASQGAEALLKILPRSPEVYGWLAFIEAGRGQNAKALEMAESCLSLLGRKGIGASISQGEIYPEIVAVQKETPADRDGLKVGDKIIAVNGQDVRLHREEEEPTQAVVKFLRTGEKVTFLVHRPGSCELKEIEVKPEELWPEQAVSIMKFKELVASSKRRIDPVSLRKLLDEFYEKLKL
ncbi:MAG: PDZ domain-containing protein [Candidatus Saccharicenans sp.]|uniref:PDZ domain-containing protein n=1 Tax=Candidatus Saccharicenans sp. TaxID=2819258 RepID=UPI00404A739E